MWNLDFLVQFWDAISQLRSRKHREPRNPRPKIPRAQKILVYFIYYVINGLQKVFNSKFLLETRPTETLWVTKGSFNNFWNNILILSYLLKCVKKVVNKKTNVMKLNFEGL